MLTFYGTVVHHDRMPGRTPSSRGIARTLGGRVRGAPEGARLWLLYGISLSTFRKLCVAA